MKCFGAFAAAAWLAIVAASAISIFQLGQYERVYGPSTTFVMILWYGLIPAFLAGASAWLATLGKGRRALAAAPLVGAALSFGAPLAAFMAAVAFAPLLLWLFYPWILVAPFALTRFVLARYGILSTEPINGGSNAALDVSGLGADDHPRAQ